MSMETQITVVPTGQRSAILMKQGLGRDAKHRIGKYMIWLDAGGIPWHSPDLADYRDHLLERLKPSSASAHLSTIRARYKELIRDNRDDFYDLISGRTDNILERKAFVDEMITRLKNAIAPASAKVKIKVVQDAPDEAHVRLTQAQADALIAAPGVKTLKGLRDTALITLMLCTGIRENEARLLDAVDLRQTYGGDLALHVREGKGAKQRLIPIGALDAALVVVDKWLEKAGISEGAVFRGFYKGGRRLRPNRISLRQIENIIKTYPIAVDGKLITVAPHDLRRTYARRLYDAGVDLVAIKQNLGHRSMDTTLGYIGALDAEKRKPPMIYTFNGLLRDLADLPVQMRHD
jgi:integrase